MDLSAIDPLILIASMMVAATPILLAAIGELVVEKAGVLNLGVEGMMITGAIAGFAIAVETGSPLIGFIAAAVGAALLSLIFGYLTQYLLSNQVATGLALTLFGLGLSSLMGQTYVGVKPPLTNQLDFPLLSDLPVVGPILFQHDFMVYVSIALIAGVWAVLKYSRIGLILRAVGENHDAAHALGYKVVRIRMASIAFGGACAGLGGGLPEPGARTTMDRRHDRRRGLDRTGNCGFCQLAPLAGVVGGLSVWGGHHFTAEFAGRGRCDTSRILVDVTISDNHTGSGYNQPVNTGRTCCPWPNIPRL